MKKTLYIAIIILAHTIVCATRLYAQDDKTSQKEYSDYNYYSRAEQDYNNGNFQKAITHLEHLLHSQDASMRSSAYRLIALCHIEQGDIEQARRDVLSLLESDPYFSPAASDNPILIDIINSSKHRGGATITTASQQSESIGESPVPVTLITEDMLRDIGARTLKDALLAYVPGITDIASNEEQNIAVRGAYSSSQEKVLILLNGHRMNSYVTNTGKIDFSMSLEKVKQIEVLRGPASSIYGGVALAGVVNIITKDGSDVDGVKVKGSVGNYKQMQGDFLLGKHYMDFDFLVWGSLYSCNGEKHHYAEGESNSYYAGWGVPTDGDAYLGCYKQKPSNDMGVNIKWKAFSLMYNTSYSKMQPVLTLTAMSAPYDNSRYLNINGATPGISVHAQHLKFAYDKEWGNFTLGISACYDILKHQQYQVAGDTIPSGIIEIPLYGSDTNFDATTGLFQNHTFNENNYGAKVQASYHYNKGIHDGTILLGSEINRFKLQSTYYIEGDQYNRVLYTYKNLEDGGQKNVLTGGETMANIFAQIKHTFWKQLIFNAGIRYDQKRRQNLDLVKKTAKLSNLHIFSPRIALILNKPKWNIKASYSKSFADVPYFYRSSQLDTSWGILLDPEILQTTQISFASNEQIPGLNAEINFYYNNLSNYMAYILLAGAYNSTSSNMKNIGAELSLSYQYDKLTVRANMTCQKTLKYDNSYIAYSNGNKAMNIPNVTANVVLSYDITRRLQLHANANITSKQHFGYLREYEDYETEDEIYDIPAHCIIGGGLQYKLPISRLSTKSLDFNVDMRNILNTRYYTGSATVAARQPQPGRWILGSVSYTF